ncbi:MAG: zinc metalloprotease HtpX [Methanothrix sp.]|nr:zinc metalloprotease HtpX [Methanothrix sp.]
MRGWKSDRGLEARMAFTFFLLGIIYLAFFTLMVYLGINPSFIAIFSLGAMFVQYYFSDTIVIKSMGAKILTESEAPELHEMINRLCSMADLPKPRIAMVKTNVPNAFATGRNQRNAVVAVTTGLMQQLNSSELEAVLAHELTHVKNRDAMVLTIASFISTLAYYLMLFGGGGRRDKDSGNAILIFLASIVVYAASYLLIMSLSRYREFAADRGASIITGQPSQLASALRKISVGISRIPNEDLRKVEGANAFFIIPAVSKSTIFNLFSTHPSLEARLAALERIEKELEISGV